MKHAIYVEQANTGLWLDCSLPISEQLALIQEKFDTSDWFISNTLGFSDLCHGRICSDRRNLSYPHAITQFIQKFGELGTAALIFTDCLATAVQLIDESSLIP